MKTLFGLPAHPFLVHFAVVLIPLVAALLISVSLVPKLRAKLSNAMLVASIATAIYIPIVMNSGEGLEEILGEEGNEILEKHATLGDSSYWIGIFLVLASALVWWTSKLESKGVKTSKALTALVMTFSVLIGVASTVQVARIGHTGATAVWHDAGEEE